MSRVYTNIAKMRSDQNKETIRPGPVVVSPLSTNPQTGKPTNQSPTSDHLEKPEKYTTHLEPTLVKRLKLFAVQKDLKDYQVIKNALLLYFEKNE